MAARGCQATRTVYNMCDEAFLHPCLSRFKNQALQRDCAELKAISDETLKDSVVCLLSPYKMDVDRHLGTSQVV